MKPLRILTSPPVFLEKWFCVSLKGVRLPSCTSDTRAEGGRARKCEKMTGMLPDLQDLKVKSLALSTTALRLLEDAFVCSDLVSIHSEGDFITNDPFHPRGPPKCLDVPKTWQILQFMEKRCRKRDSSAGSRTGPLNSARECKAWIEWLALPVRKGAYYSYGVIDDLSCQIRTSTIGVVQADTQHTRAM